MLPLAAHIDHTLLRPDATRAEIDSLCAEARQYGFATVCVPPYYVKQAATALAGSGVGICTVVGFPLGYTMPTVKAVETERALFDGATEVDMVLNLAAFKSGEDVGCAEEIAALATICHEGGALLKVIIETAFLTEAEIIRAGQLAATAGADFVKTSTGFASRGASLDDIRILRAYLPAQTRIKAAGGIRTRAQAEALRAAGADRLGCSASVAIVTSPSESPLAAPDAPAAPSAY
jgi:deoxyribose-phosphate aldolase